MFSLLTIEDKLLLEPMEFRKLVPVNTKKSKTKEDSIEDINKDINKYSDLVYLKLREKYISKIIMNQGLVISIKNFQIKSDLIVEIEGVVDIKYECSLIIFCPKEGDILYGTICDCDKKYIIVDCDLIKVKVPVQKLMEPHFFNMKEHLWFWSYNDKNFFYDKKLKCKLKVLDVCFKSENEISKIIKEKMLEEDEDSQITEQDLRNALKKEDYMEIYCSMSQEGLGPIKWWE